MSATTIAATFRVTTPMFCGGANGQNAELRAASFKGVLRFWWRACAWPRYRGDLEQIRKAEANLFGSPETGQSRVWLRLDLRAEPSKRPGDKVLKPAGVKYLGFGLSASDRSKVRGGGERDGGRAEPGRGRRGQERRDCLAESFDLQVRLLYRGVDPADIESLEQAVTALGMVGGMGARSRRGFGSLTLTTLQLAGEDRPVPATPEDLDAMVGGLYSGAPMHLPGYTAFSGQSRHLVLQCDKADATEVLNQLGMEYAGYRRRERGGWRSEKLGDDYTIAVRGQPPGVHPKRIAFGLPLNVSRKKKPVEPVEHTRRASPLMFHIHQFDSRAVAVVSFLPARFLPKGQSAVILANGGRRHIDDGAAVYQPVVDFLDFLEQESIFTPVRQVGR
jgi:CRISPR-associated protein Cmr1